MKKILFLLALYVGVVFAQQPNQCNADKLQTVAPVNIDYSTIKSDINTILSNKYLSNTQYSLAVYSLQLDKWVYTNNYQKLLTPASNTKLFTTFTSYTQLGKDYNIQTSVYTDGNISNGVLNGNIYLVGGGDPLFNINDVEIIADEIKRLGIRKIAGNIYGDCSFFDEVSDRFKYSNDESEVQAVAPITALSIEKNIVTVLVTSGSVPGKQVNVQCNPPSTAFVTSVSAVVSRTGKKSVKKAEAELYDERYDANDYANGDSIMNKNSEFEDYSLYAGDSKSTLIAAAKKGKSKKTTAKKEAPKSNTPIQITTSMNSDGKQQFFVKGSLPANRTYSYQYYIKNPALVVAGTLKDRLQSGGISITGYIANDDIGKVDINKKKLLYTFSRNINDVIVPINKMSDNYLAESLFKLNGACAGYDKNCAKSAYMTTQKIMTNLDIPADGLRLNDGSGLSRRNLVTTESLVGLLAYSYKMPFAKNMDSSLSIAGIDGTLRKRMKDTPACNNLRAKTGTLRNVSSLSGYVNTKSGDTLIFAFIFNGGNVGYYKEIENQLGSLLSKY